MSQDPNIPTGVILGAGVLIAVSMALAAGARGELWQAQEVAAAAPRFEERQLRFEDGPGGEVVVRAEDGTVIASFAATEHGFVRGALRGMFRRRKLDGLDRTAPFRLFISTQGRLTLSDPLTAQVIDLQAFGSENYTSFLPLLRAPGQP